MPPVLGVSLFLLALLGLNELFRFVHELTGGTTCPTVYSGLGLISDIKFQVGWIPLANKVTGKLICLSINTASSRSEESFRPVDVILPTLYCPTAMLFDKVEVTKRFIDTKCLPTNSGRFFSLAAAVDNAGNTPFVRESELLQAIAWGDVSAANLRPIIKRSANLGVEGWLNSYENERIWTPVASEDVPNYIMVFAGPATVLAMGMGLARKVTREWVEGLISKGKLIRTLPDPDGRYFVNEIEDVSIERHIYKIVYFALVREADECSICLESSDSDNPLMAETCGHRFHNGCINEWKRYSKPHKCPCCKLPLH